MSERRYVKRDQATAEMVGGPSDGQLLAVRGKEGCRDVRCTRIGKKCVGWHCPRCGKPCSSQGHGCEDGL